MTNVAKRKNTQNTQHQSVNITDYTLIQLNNNLNFPLKNDDAENAENVKENFENANSPKSTKNNDPKSKCKQEHTRAYSTGNKFDKINLKTNKENNLKPFNTNIKSNSSTEKAKTQRKVLKEYDERISKENNTRSKSKDENVKKVFKELQKVKDKDLNSPHSNFKITFGAGQTLHNGFGAQQTPKFRNIPQSYNRYNNNSFNDNIYNNNNTNEHPAGNFNEDIPFEKLINNTLNNKKAKNLFNTESKPKPIIINYKTEENRDAYKEKLNNFLCSPKTNYHDGKLIDLLVTRERKIIEILTNPSKTETTQADYNRTHYYMNYKTSTHQTTYTPLTQYYTQNQINKNEKFSTANNNPNQNDLQEQENEDNSMERLDDNDLVVYDIDEKDEFRHENEQEELNESDLLNSNSKMYNNKNVNANVNVNDNSNYNNFKTKNKNVSNNSHEISNNNISHKGNISNISGSQNGEKKYKALLNSI